MSGSARNKTAKCAKCGGEAIIFLSSSGARVYELYEDEALMQAEWCEHCEKIICASCAGFSSAGVGMQFSYTKCPICGGKTKYASEEIWLTKIRTK